MQHKSVTRQAVSHQLADMLSKEVRAEYSSGEKLPPLRALARRFDVSPTTMSQALIVLAREGLIHARHGSGFYVRQPEDKRHVGVLLDLDLALPDISFFWRRVVQQVRLGLRAQGYRTRLYAGHFRPADAPDFETCVDLIEDVAEDRLSGLTVIWGPRSPQWEQPLRERNVPIVGGFDSPTMVTIDFTSVVRQAARRLVQAGRRKLAFLGWGPNQSQPWSANELLRVFADELQKHGVTLNPSWARCDIHPNLRGAGWTVFRELWTATREKPDGLLVTDDILFHTATSAIHELGIRVPEQLLVVTHSNKGSEYQYPFPVWRTEADPDAYAAAHVESLVKLLRGETMPNHPVVLPCRFIVSGDQPAGTEEIVGEMETVTTKAARGD